jgi:hypothetical protein
MQVDEICNEAAAPDPPRTLPREETGANENPNDNNDNLEDREATEDGDEEEAAIVCSGKRRRVRKKWTVIGEWHANQFLASEIEARILRIATGRMEDPRHSGLDHSLC